MNNLPRAAASSHPSSAATNDGAYILITDMKVISQSVTLSEGHRLWPARQEGRRAVCKAPALHQPGGQLRLQLT